MLPTLDEMCETLNDASQKGFGHDDMVRSWRSLDERMKDRYRAGLRAVLKQRVESLLHDAFVEGWEFTAGMKHDCAKAYAARIISQLTGDTDAE